MRHAARVRQGGYVMVLLAMLLFGLMAMAALVIDIGFARLAQRQMQSAADTAALEGLRGEGTISYGDRQLAAEQMIAWKFDDDLDAANGDTGIDGNGGAFGTGPLVQFSGGAGPSDLFASQLMDVDPANPVYKPTIERGEETTGEFRANIQRGGVVDESANLYSLGPAVPYLFARGSTIKRELIGRGISVGSSALAEARNAVKVGPAVASVLGIRAVAYSLNDWPQESDTDSDLETAAYPPRFFNISSDITQGLAIGETIEVLQAASGEIAPPSGYCVIFDPNTYRIAGFGILGQETLVESGFVAPRNASARLGDAWDALSALETDERSALIETNRSLSFSLKAPVLVRN